MKVKTDKRSTTSTHLHVKGILWCGKKSSYDYPLDNNDPSRRVPNTMEQARRIAGDFQSLDSAEVVVTESEITTTRTTIGIPDEKDRRANDENRAPTPP